MSATAMVKRSDSARLCRHVFTALASAPATGPDADFMHLAEEYATRGGINEQVLRESHRSERIDTLAESLDGVLRRISGGRPTQA
jgi:pyrroline-5-carboxylate reductase